MRRFVGGAGSGAGYYVYVAVGMAIWASRARHIGGEWREGLPVALSEVPAGALALASQVAS